VTPFAFGQHVSTRRLVSSISPTNSSSNVDVIDVVLRRGTIKRHRTIVQNTLLLSWCLQRVPKYEEAHAVGRLICFCYFDTQKTTRGLDSELSCTGSLCNVPAVVNIQGGNRSCFGQSDAHGSIPQIELPTSNPTLAVAHP
jgi:hypothetical protein